ncbi:hypothetical protein ACFQ6Q_11310 [Streptomyces sp. NPDC056437]|uniref:hypothetical protein n=1 Tax=Streptomyces sp. NPDC056437 TaxID=3345816 RepID=UPI00367BF6E3
MEEATTEQLAAGEPKGLTPEMCAYLRGETPDELGASADAFLAAFSVAQPPSPRSGGHRGPDVRSTSGTTSAGAELYREKHGLDEDGNRPEKKKAPTSNRNPFAVKSYTLETR